MKSLKEFKDDVKNALSSKNNDGNNGHQSGAHTNPPPPIIKNDHPGITSGIPAKNDTDPGWKIPPSDLFRKFSLIMIKAQNLEACNTLIDDLDIPFGKGGAFNETGYQDREFFRGPLKRTLSLHFELFVRQSDVDDPTSLDKLRNFTQKGTKHRFEVSENNLTEVNIQLEPIIMAMLSSKVRASNTMPAIDKIIEEEEGGRYFPKVDIRNEALNDFADAPWLKMISDRAIHIAGEEFKKHLKEPSPEDGEALIPVYYKNVLTLDSVINWKCIPLSYKLELLKEALDVVDKIKIFQHRFAIDNPDAASNHVQVLMIKQQFVQALKVKGTKVISNNQPDLKDDSNKGGIDVQQSSPDDLSGKIVDPADDDTNKGGASMANKFETVIDLAASSNGSTSNAEDFVNNILGKK